MQSKKPKRLLIFLLVLLLLMTGTTALGEGETKVKTNAQGMPYVLDAFEGTVLDLSAYEGKAVFINFFASWCGYCIQEMPTIKRVWEEYSSDELAIVMVHVWSDSYNSVEDESKTEYVKEEFQMQDMTFVEDRDQMLSYMVGLTGFPTSVFIDKEGYLLGSASALGYNDLTRIMEMLSVGKAVVE